jgi:hypothetical protein
VKVNQLHLVDSDALTYVLITLMSKHIVHYVGDEQAAWQMVDREILDLLPKTKEAKSIVRLMDRDSLTFDVALQRMEDSLGVPKV